MSTREPTDPNLPQVPRREWIVRVLQGASGIALTRSFALGQTDSAAWVPQVLTPAENEAVVSLGECIVPGSREALCNRIIDLVLTQEDAGMHQQLAAALQAIDQEAQNRFQTSFRQSSGTKQNEILQAASAEKSALHPPFQIVKEWIADAYWSSEKGLRELGWTGRMAWDSFPGCEHPAPHN